MKRVLLILLPFLILAGSGVMAQTKDEREKLLHLRKNSLYQEGITLALEIDKREPDSHYIAAILAGFYSLNNDKALALTWLERSIQRGNYDYQSFLEDEVFKNIKTKLRYKKLIDLAKKFQEHEQKTIHVFEGKWTDFELESQYELPEVHLSISYDEKNFMIKARVKDDHFKDGNRAWRYGDGFFINIAAPENFNDIKSDRFYGCGFSLENGKPIGVLINKDGRYYLRSFNTITPEIMVDEKNKTADYVITIPWSFLYPFNPLMDEKGGINILYISQNEDHSRKILRYVHGVYDSEDTKFRRFAPIVFHPSEKSKSQISCKMDSRLISEHQSILRLAIWTQDELESRFSVGIKGAGTESLIQTFNHKLKKGRNIIEKRVDLPIEGGTYEITVTVDEKFSWQDTYYKYDRDALKKLKKEIETRGAASDEPVYTNSLHALQYRFHELEDAMQLFNDRSDPGEVKDELEKIQSLYQKWLKDKTIYNNEGYLLSAFKSPMDASLQPFSIILPKNFNPDHTYRLLVGLHGSGVNEVGFLRYSSRYFKKYENVIVLGPRGRGLSDWWTGQTEEDAIDLIKLIKSMFKIDQTLCYGFSMGGYGTWRMSLLHPELFDGALVISGFPHHPWQNISENDMNNYIGRGTDLKYLVIHGTEDRALKIADTDKFVDKLKSAGYGVKYIRVEGGGHGNFSVEEMVFEWVESTFGF